MRKGAIHTSLALFFLLFSSLCLVASASAQGPGMDEGMPMDMDMMQQMPDQQIGGQQADGMCGSPGCVCGPGCGCPMCMAAKRGMGHGPGCMCEVCMGKGMGMAGRKGQMYGMAPGMMGKKMGMGMKGDMLGMTWPPMNDSCRKPDYYLVNRDFLGLDDAQVESLRKMSVALESKKILLGAKVKSLELELSEIVTTPGFKASDALGKLAEIEKARTELRTLVIKTSADAQGVLNADQLGQLEGFGLPPAAGACSCMPGKKAMKSGGGEDMQQMMQKMRREMMQKNMQ